MPIYEYGCQKCGKKTEAIQRVGERRLKICPHCGGKLKKLASAPAIQFKGSGWYVTDYASSKPDSSRAKKEDKEHADKSGSGEKTAEKPAEKAPEKPVEKKKEPKEKKGKE